MPTRSAWPLVTENDSKDTIVLPPGLRGVPGSERFAVSNPNPLYHLPCAVRRTPGIITESPEAEHRKYALKPAVTAGWSFPKIPAKILSKVGTASGVFGPGRNADSRTCSGRCGASGTHVSPATGAGRNTRTPGPTACRRRVLNCGGILFASAEI